MFIIYKTVNKINNRFYIGVHNSTRIWYKGSGSVLKRAIKKYGLVNFERETLFEFDSAEEAYAKEAELVDENTLLDPLCYNVKPGGFGGKTGLVTVRDAITNEYIGAVSNMHPLYISGQWVHILKGRDTFLKARTKSIEVRKGNPGSKRGFKCTEETRQRIRDARLGKKASDETKEKMSNSMKGIKRIPTTCPHCGKEGAGSAMKQWHFDRCRLSLHAPL